MTPGEDPALGRPNDYRITETFLSRYALMIAINAATTIGLPSRSLPRRKLATKLWVLESILRPLASFTRQISADTSKQHCS